MRKQYPVIVYGKYTLLLPEDENLFVYTRELEEDKLLVVCNFSSAEQAFSVPEEFADAECLISNTEEREYEGTVALKPYEAFVLLR